MGSNKLKLVLAATGEEVKIGDRVTTFRGESGVVTAMQEPQHPGSTGRVSFKQDGQQSSSEFYPGVINAEWV